MTIRTLQSVQPLIALRTRTHPNIRSLASTLDLIDTERKQREQERDGVLQAKVEKLLKKAERLKQLDLTREKMVLADKIKQMETDRNMTETIVHVDMDAFYASVEELDQPELKTRPMAVGGVDMITTANYLARQFGVRSAMPGYIAKRLCPDLVFVKPDFEKYTRMSMMIRAVLARYDPNYAAASLDEAYLNITQYMKQHSEQSVEEVVAEMRDQIFKETSLTASAGIGSNTLIAKIATDVNKPNGQFRVEPTREAVMAYLQTLPVRKVPGVGRVTERELHALGIKTVGDLRENLITVSMISTPALTDFLIRVALGIGSTTVDPTWERKSISVERTFVAIFNHDAMYDKMRELASMLADDLAKEKLKGQTLTIRIKASNFESWTRQKALPSPIYSAKDLYDVAKILLVKELQERPDLEVRLMGIGLSKLSSRMIKMTGIGKFLVRSEGQAAIASSPTKRPRDNSVKESLTSIMSESEAADGNDSEGSRKRQAIEGSSGDRPVPKMGAFGALMPYCSSSFVRATQTKMSEDSASNKFIDNSRLLTISTESLDYQPPLPTIPPHRLAVCPICCQRIANVALDDLRGVNGHVDVCLNRGTIREIGANQASSLNVANTNGNRFPSPSSSDAFRTLLRGANAKEKGGKSVSKREEHQNGKSNVCAVCPICKKTIADARVDDLVGVNKHVDFCLGQQ
ncbi:DNA-directed DNA polymerase [Synchytrium endobioticum]|nr:DNA-directed DNA polymerase [Synchytrium endobioticum]